MATLTLSANDVIVFWTLSGLTGTYYMDLGVATSPASGTPTPPNGIVNQFGEFTPPPNAVSSAFICSPGTYTFYAYGRTADGLYWPGGSGTITVGSTTFAWDVPKTVGSNTITAYEWNKLIIFIRGKIADLSATNAVIGQSVSAEMYNQLINGMGASSSYLVSAGQPITAAKLNLLVTLANNL